MGAQSAPAQGKAADMPDGFGVAVVREDGKWRCSSMRKASLNSLTAAETELPSGIAEFLSAAVPPRGRVEAG